MAFTIYRGSTPTLRFTPTNGMKVSELGKPKVLITQDYVQLDPEATINAEENCISVTLTETESMALAAGVETKVQQVWRQEDGSAIHFPIWIIQVADSLSEQPAVE